MQLANTGCVPACSTARDSVKTGMSYVHHLARFVCLCGALLVFSTSGAHANPLFEDNSLLAVELELPLSKINASRRQKTPKQSSGLLRWTTAGGVQSEMPIRVRARGNFRRKNCTNPPLRLNFKKTEAENTLFSGQDKLKLVRPCTNSNRATQWVVLEYLIYQSYQILTDEAFRVRPLSITYTGDRNGKTPENHFGFIIEDEDAMAARNGGNILQAARANKRAVDPTTLARLDLFQFMIGNNDFSAIRADRGQRCCHNIRLITNDAGLGLRPAPYDFDFAGMVDTDYATPPPNIRIRSVRTRYYRGFCQQPNETARTVALFNSKRTALYDLYRSSVELSGPFKQKAIDYLDSFYEMINDPDELNSKVVGRCR